MQNEGANQEVSTDELAQIRELNDFDLRLLLSEIRDHGWEVAQRLLMIMPTNATPLGMLVRFMPPEERLAVLVELAEREQAELAERRQQRGES